MDGKTLGLYWHAPIILQSVSNPQYKNCLQDRKSENVFRRFKLFISKFHIFVSTFYIFVSTYGYFVSGLTPNLEEASYWYEKLFKMIHFMTDYQITEKICKIIPKSMFSYLLTQQKCLWLKTCIWILDPGSVRL